MTNGDKREFKVLIKEGTIEALKSSAGQDAIVGALKSEPGQDAIAEAMTTGKAKDAILDVFVDAFHAVVVPVFEDQNKRIKRLEKTAGMVT